MVAFQLVATDLAKKGQFKDVDVIDEVSKYLKFYFLYTIKTNNTKTFSKIPAIICQEKYEDAPEEILLQFKKTDKYQTNWVCPDTDRFTLLNEPDTYA